MTLMNPSPPDRREVGNITRRKTDVEDSKCILLKAVSSENIARIANAVQVTICLLVATSVY